MISHVPALLPIPPVSQTQQVGKYISRDTAKQQELTNIQQTNRLVRVRVFPILTHMFLTSTTSLECSRIAWGTGVIERPGYG